MTGFIAIGTLAEISKAERSIGDDIPNQYRDCDGRDGERPVEWDGGHGLLVVRRLKAELKEIR
ncbi:hypothetical protein [Bifidobacterium longum]|mgnify:CR=1 FL=1|uniref:hypothetical protein n=1 Tax=Bifidobacterium longum TaxID=216816 RepID=UPI002023DFB0|nr:hypothetical protein [Bifidobacterium longum]